MRLLNGIGPYRSPRRYRNRSEGVTRFQVLGDRCSGTNFLHHLLLRNFPGLEPTEELGWKHGFVDRTAMERPGLLVVIVRRHILRWLPSVHASPFELSSTMQRMNFSDFIRAEWTPVWRVERNGEQIEKPAYEDYDPEQKRRFENALSMRSAKLRYFDETASMPVNVVLTRFEDVNMAPERWLSEVAETFAITPSKSFTGVGRYRGGAPGAYRPRVFRRIAPPDRKFILGNVDTEAEEQAGYVLADTPAFDGLGMFDRRSIRGVVRYLRKGPA